MIKLPDRLPCRCTVISKGTDRVAKGADTTTGDFVEVTVGDDLLAQQTIYRSEWEGKWVDATPADAVRTYFNPSKRNWQVTPRSRAAKAKLGCWTVTTTTPCEAMPAATFIRDFLVALNKKASGQYS